jgi:Uma2 family endonuclease
MTLLTRTYTAEDVWELSTAPEYADLRLELSEGELVIMSPAGGSHGVIALQLGWLIKSFVESHNLGYVFGAETGFILGVSDDGAETLRAPDVAFVAHERLPSGAPDRYVPLAPDLAVEVVSPNDRADAVNRKLLDYLRYQTRLVWLVYPATRTIIVHDGAAARVLGDKDALDGGEVLPGFSVPVGRVFEG